VISSTVRQQLRVRITIRRDHISKAMLNYTS